MNNTRSQCVKAKTNQYQMQICAHLATSLATMHVAVLLAESTSGSERDMDGEGVRVDSGDGMDVHLMEVMEVVDPADKSGFIRPIGSITYQSCSPSPHLWHTHLFFAV